MASKPKLTPAEWDVMQTVWDLGEAVSVRDVLEHLYPEGQRAYTTVQTVMNILEKKNLLSRKKIGMVNFYQPTCTRESITRSEMHRLVDGVFSGSIPAVASTLMSLEDFDLDDLAQIRELLLQREEELKGDSNG